MNAIAPAIDRVRTPAPPARSVAPAVPRWLQISIGLAIAAGIFFRLYHVDRKVYWDDEIFTSLHVLGLTEGDVVARSAQLTNVAAVRALIHPGAAATNSVGATVRSIALEDPHHTPLYYILAFGWVRAFGDSIGALRMLSVVLGLIALPCMYWLCRELFSSVGAAWLGTALLAISPIGVLYSQEAREYALWSIAILVMGAAFIRAARLGSLAAWAVYAGTLVFALYVFPFSAFLALGNVAVLAATDRCASLRARVTPIVASAAALVAFTPWLIVLAQNIGQINRSMHTTIAHKHSAAFVLRAFLSLFRLDVIDLNVLHRATINLVLLIPVLALVIYAALGVARSDDRRRKLFIFALMIFASAPFVLPDLLVSGERTVNPRYFLPLYIGLDLCLVSLFWSKFQTGAAQRKPRALWPAIFGLLIVARIVSCGVSSQATTWWSKYNERSIDVARAVNAAGQPLIVTDNFVEYLLSLSNYLDDRVALDLRPRCYQCSLVVANSPSVAAIQRSGPQTDVYLLGPSLRLGVAARTLMRERGTESHYHCIDVRGNCTSPLHLW